MYNRFAIAQMLYSQRFIYRIVLAAAFSALLLILPYSIHAQAGSVAQNELAVAIKNAILSDPRSGNLSPDQINVMANALTAQASAQGMTSHDLLWRPMLAHTMALQNEAAAANCGNVPTSVCAFNRALGLSGSDMTVLTILGVLFALILAAIAAYLELAHRQRLRTQNQTNIGS